MELQDSSEDSSDSDIRDDSITYEGELTPSQLKRQKITNEISNSLLNVSVSSTT